MRGFIRKGSIRGVLRIHTNHNGLSEEEASSSEFKTIKFAWIALAISFGDSFKRFEFNSNLDIVFNEFWMDHVHTLGASSGGHDNANLLFEITVNQSAIILV